MDSLCPKSLNIRRCTMDKDITKTTFFQYLRPINFKKLNVIVEKLSADKYVKKLTTKKMLILLIFSQLFNVESLTHLSTIVSADDDLSELINLDSISTSQLSRTLRNKQPELLNKVFKELAVKYISQKGTARLKEDLGQINIIDASIISMALSQYPWAEYIKTKAGVKLNLRLKFHQNIDEVTPDKVVISSARNADRTKMDKLVPTAEGVLNIFDRGYVDYKKFDDFTEDNILFLSRLKKNAKIEYIHSETKRLDKKTIRESTVLLGEKTNYTKMKHKLRLLEIPDDRNPEKIIKIITNDFTKTTQEISDLYRYRWKIETFFKWIKQHLHVKKFYGMSKNAIKNQLFSALITHLLLSFFKRDTQTKKSLLKLKRLLDIYKHKPLKLLLEKLKKPPSHTSSGRKSYNHEEVFALIIQETKNGTPDYYYDESNYMIW